MLARKKLDADFSFKLRNIARKKGGTSEQITLMQSKRVQDFLEGFVLQLEGTSLTVERKFAQIKKWETSRLTDVATASENNILQTHARERELVDK